MIIPGFQDALAPYKNALLFDFGGMFGDAIQPGWVCDTRLTADGIQCGVASWALSSDHCCQPVECIDVCQMACQFISLLPSGPMWDLPKQRAIEYIMSNPCTDPIDLPQECSGLVAHAIYKAQMLVDLVNNAAWPAHREANAFTAADSLDSWLERLGWFDCYRTTCRSVMLGEMTAFEIFGECGPVYCPVDYGANLERAVKGGIVAALTRINMGFVENLAGINWVIEPLGAVLKPHYPEGEEIVDCCNIHFEICNFKDTLTERSVDVSGCYDQRDKQIPAWYSNLCGVLGQAMVLWPGVIAAECIVRSILHKSCPNIIHRCCPSTDLELQAN